MAMVRYIPLIAQSPACLQFWEQYEDLTKYVEMFEQGMLRALVSSYNSLR